MRRVLEAARMLVQMLEEEEKQNFVQLNTLSEGDTFKIGEHDFIVLRQDEDRTMVTSKELMAENVKFDDETRDYGKSYLKKLIEEEIQPIIEDAVGADNLMEHNANLVTVDMQDEFEPVKCKVRPITFDEARRYNCLLVNKDLPDWYWTLTPWSTEERGWKYSLAVVSPSGGVNCYYYYSSGGVRPFCILKSNIFVSKGE